MPATRYSNSLSALMLSSPLWLDFYGLYRKDPCTCTSFLEEFSAVLRTCTASCVDRMLATTTRGSRESDGLPATTGSALLRPRPRLHMQKRIYRVQIYKTARSGGRSYLSQEYCSIVSARRPVESTAGVAVLASTTDNGAGKRLSRTDITASNPR